MLLEPARQVLDALGRLAPAARNRADSTGDAAPLADVVARALREVPAARELLDPGRLREVSDLDPEVGRALRGYFEAPFAVEARLRAAVASRRLPLAGRSAPLSEALAAYREPDEALRRAARQVLDPALDELERDLPTLERAFQGTARQGKEASSRAPGGATRSMRTAPPTSTPRPGVLFLPSPEVLQALAAGGPLDPTLLAGLAASNAVGSVRADTAPRPPGNPSVLAPTEEELRELAERTRGQEITGAAAGGSRLGELCRALAEASGRRPETFGAWRAAAAGADVADFRPSEGLLSRFAPSRAIRLPFESPGVPLARPGALARSDLDASSAVAVLLGVGAASSSAVVGAALALSAPTRPLLRRGLREVPANLEQASRVLALALALDYANAIASAGADGNAEAMRDLHQDLLGAAPPPALARWWAAEAALARAPGEGRALYAHTSRLAELMRFGLSVAISLRDHLDEDWFDNPRLTPEVLTDHVRAATAAEEGALVAWLRGHAGL